MPRSPDHAAPPVALDHAGLDALIWRLTDLGYATHGPTLRDGAIVHGPIGSVADLPRGMTDEQAPGRYRLKPRGDQALFGHAAGPDAWKRVFHEPSLRLWHAEGEGDAMRLVPDTPKSRALALLGMRACDLAAIGILDRVLTGGASVDPHYAARRAAFIVAVNCAESGALCFCASMGTGPACGAGYDIALTELTDTATLVAVAGTARGQTVLDAIPSRPATAAEIAAAEAAPARAAAAQTRAMPPDAPAALAAAPEHPAWDAVAKRCLSCANCTLVCPTCFCCTTEDRTDLDGSNPERWRRWDSCFTADFSHIHGGPVRPSGRARYRQWLTHKLSTWVEQFGSSGCVGCGRCVAWCPVGIDLVAEAKALCVGAAVREEAS